MILVACGLKREARAIRGVGMIPVAGGGDAKNLENELEDAITCIGPFDIILSNGIAGALDPALRVGDVVIDGDEAPLRWLRAALGNQHVSSPQRKVGSRAESAVVPREDPSFRWDDAKRIAARVLLGRVVGEDTMLTTAAAKAALHASTGGAAVDMESHVAARVAQRHGLAYAALRVISDTADEDLPPAVLVGMKPDGGMALGAVLASLARHPTQLPALIRTGRRAGIAFRELGRVHDVLARAGIGGLDLGELALDMR